MKTLSGYRFQVTRRGATLVEVAISCVLVGLADLNRSDLPYEVYLAKTGYPASLVSADFDGNDSLTFDMYGRPFTGSPLAPLVADGSIVIQSSGRQRTIVVDAATGAASVQP
jgi:hypothetical protein